MTSLITALIPARGGSKGIPKKNIVDFLGKPLIAWTIEFAREASVFDSVVVSTDSLEIAEISEKYGATVVMRPEELAGDNVTALAVLEHAFEHYIKADSIAYLQPTSPFRLQSHLQEAMKIFPDYDSIVSVMRVPHNMIPESIMTRSGNEVSFFIPIGEGGFNRHNKPQYVCRNGPSLLLTKRTTITEKKSLYGERIGCIEMAGVHSVDIDTLEDLTIARALLGVFLDSKKI